MLQSIEITKLFGRFDYSLSFSDEGIMIITGPNGYGKSTILRIINYLCNERFDKVLSYSFTKLKVVCNNDTLQIKKENGLFSINQYVFPYPEYGLNQRRGHSSFIRRIGYNEFIDIRNGEKIQLDGNLPKQLSILDEEAFEQRFVFSILDALGEDVSSEKFSVTIGELSLAFEEIQKIQKSIGKVHFIQEQRLIEKRIISEEDRRYNQPRVEYVTVINENSEKLKAELAEIMKKHSSLSSNLDSTYIKRLFEADQAKQDSTDVLNKLRVLQKNKTNFKNMD